MVVDPEPHAEIPWFWTDQFDLNMQIVGVPERWDRRVTRGDPQSGRCVVFYMEKSRVVGATAFNLGRDVRACRQLVETGMAFTDVELADEDRRLKDMVRERAARQS